MSAWTPAMEAELRMLVLREYRAQQARESACKGKDKFDTPQMDRDSMPRRTTHGKITTYRCKACRKWHIGSYVGRTAGRPRAEA